MRQISITLMDELDAALALAAGEAGVSKSRMIETFLREHGTVRRFVQVVRSEPPDAVMATGPRLRSLARRGNASASSASEPGAPSRAPRKAGRPARNPAPRSTPREAR